MIIYYKTIILYCTIISIINNVLLCYCTIKHILILYYNTLLIYSNCNRRLPITMYSGDLCPAERPNAFLERSQDGG